ncbi:hypothetical protein AB0D29_19640 [Streptomyces sp. NPDC048424]|uniref:hypothetical protein n=1 Tax=Streptomyces sp. NPDC048424 TaxID=3155265 RepID=UPI00341C253C
MALMALMARTAPIGRTTRTSGAARTPHTVRSPGDPAADTATRRPPGLAHRARYAVHRQQTQPPAAHRHRALHGPGLLGRQHQPQHGPPPQHPHRQRERQGRRYAQ